MRSRFQVLVVIAALAAGAALGACGGGLYDAKGVPKIAAGGGDVCDAGQVACVVNGTSTCKTQDATHCGTGCLDCGTSAPLHADVACLGADAAPGTCGFECLDGYLKCGAACCATTAIAAGDKTTCALLDAGDVSCWGANDFGQAGDGTTTTPRTVPRVVPLGATAVAIGAGVSHACAVLQSGAVQCWGRNTAGQVTGTPGASPVLAPTASPVGSGAVAVVAGGAHTCALLASGEVRCWGSSASGQLGPTPGQPFLAGVTAIASGYDHACALGNGGVVQCWGKNDLGQLGATPSGGIATPIASGALHVSASTNQTCAGKASNGTNLDDALRCWGDSVGASWLLASPQATPAIPRKDASTATIRYDVARVAAGGHHVCVQKVGEGIDCLGENASGQLGGPLPDPPAGERVTVILPTVSASGFAAGAAHTCAVLSDGRLRCWGANDFGQLGDGNTDPVATGTLAIPSGL